MEDMVSNVTDGLGAAEAVASGAMATLVGYFKWWRDSESKLVKIGVPVAILFGTAFVLSLLS